MKMSSKAHRQLYTLILLLIAGYAELRARTCPGVTGTVLSPDGHAVVGTVVVLTKVEGGREVVRQPADEHGRFRLTQISCGAWAWSLEYKGEITPGRPLSVGSRAIADLRIEAPQRWLSTETPEDAAIGRLRRSYYAELKGDKELPEFDRATPKQQKQMYSLAYSEAIIRKALGSEEVGRGASTRRAILRRLLRRLASGMPFAGGIAERAVPRVSVDDAIAADGARKRLEIARELIAELLGAGEADRFHNLPELE
jgi:hypothetical protein